jgi:hypothetical protein
MTTDNFCFYLQNRLIQTSKTGGQWYSYTSPLVFPARGLGETKLHQTIPRNIMLHCLVLSGVLWIFILSYSACWTGLEKLARSKHSSLL